MYAYVGSRTDPLGFDLNSANGSPVGMWADGITAWIGDSTDDKVYAYTIANGNRVAAKDFDLHTNNGNPVGVWSDGESFWVGDSSDNLVYKYARDEALQQRTVLLNLNTPDDVWIDQENNEAWVLANEEVTIHNLVTGAKRVAFALANPVGDAVGIWSDGTTVWIVDRTDNRVYAFSKTGTRQNADEFNLTGANQHARSMWCDGTIMYIVDDSDDKVYAYTLSSGAHRPNDGFDLTAVNNNPVGITGNGQRLWVLDSTDKLAYAYTRDGTRSSEYDFTTPLAGATTNFRSIDLYNSHMWLIYGSSASRAIQFLVPQWFGVRTGSLAAPGNAYGVWQTDNQLQMLDDSDEDIKVWARESNQDAWERASSEDYTILGHAALTPRAVWSDGDGIAWVADQSTATVQAYNLYSGVRIADESFDLHADNQDPRGIWADGQTMWVLDATDDKLYAYNYSTKARVSAQDIDLAAANSNPRSIWGDGATIWVTDSQRAYAYDIDTMAHDADKDLYYIPSSSIPTAIWSNGLLAYLAFGQQLLVRGIATQQDHFHSRRRENADIDLHDDNANPGYITAVAGTMYVVDTTDNKLYAYGVADAVRQDSADIDLHADNGDPKGIWANESTMYVLDATDTQVYAYNRNTGARDSAKDIDLHADNANPTGIWSNGTLMWVADETDTELYAYNLADGSRSSGDDIDLHADNDAPTGVWSDGATMWVADEDDELVYAYNFSGTRDPLKEIITTQGPRSIWAAGNYIWVQTNDMTRCSPTAFIRWRRTSLHWPRGWWDTT